MRWKRFKAFNKRKIIKRKTTAKYTRNSNYGNKNVSLVCARARNIIAVLVYMVNDEFEIWLTPGNRRIGQNDDLKSEKTPISKDRK